MQLSAFADESCSFMQLTREHRVTFSIDNISVKAADKRKDNTHLN